MEELKAAQVFLSIGGAVFSVIATFVIMRYKVQQAEERLDKAEKDRAAAWKKLDELRTDTDLLQQRLGVLSNMLNPDNVAAHNRLMAKTELHLEYLRRDLDELRKAGL